MGPRPGGALGGDAALEGLPFGLPSAEQAEAGAEGGQPWDQGLDGSDDDDVSYEAGFADGFKHGVAVGTGEAPLQPQGGSPTDADAVPEPSCEEPSLVSELRSRLEAAEAELKEQRASIALLEACARASPVPRPPRGSPRWAAHSLAVGCRRPVPLLTRTVLYRVGCGLWKAGLPPWLHLQRLHRSRGLYLRHAGSNQAIGMQSPQQLPRRMLFLRT